MRPERALGWGIESPPPFPPARAPAAASLHGPMAAVSSRAAIRKLSARTAVQATSVGSSLGSHVQLRPASPALLPFNAPRAGCQCARRDRNRRRPKNRTRSASFPHRDAMLHAHRPLESGPQARAGHPIDATRRVACQPRKVRHGIPRRIRATSDTNESLHPEIELRHVAN